MTDDAWYGVTHESVARYVLLPCWHTTSNSGSKIAQHVADSVPQSKSIIIDAFCGAGGNTIAFALSGNWKRVYGIEKDAATLACAKHNAEIYGVADKITWFHGDCFEILGAVQSDTATVGALKAITAQFGVIFASPPWGGESSNTSSRHIANGGQGPGYRDAEIFDLDSMEPYNFQYLYDSFKKVTSDMILYLPRTSDLRQIAKTVDDKDGLNSKTQVVHYCTNSSSRALCTYIGNWSQLQL